MCWREGTAEWNHGQCGILRKLGKRLYCREHKALISRRPLMAAVKAGRSRGLCRDLCFGSYVGMNLTKSKADSSVRMMRTDLKNIRGVKSTGFQNKLDWGRSQEEEVFR